MGKSSDAAAPDPRLAEAQIRSMGVQETALKQIMDTSLELMPIQKETMQFGLDAARTGYQQSQEDRKYAIERRDKLTGLQDSMIEQAQQFNTGDRAKELAGKAIAGVNQQFDAAGDIASRNLTRAGVNPADGKYADMTKQLTIARALGGAAAGTAAQGQARAEGMALNDRAANVLAGYPAMGMSATGQGSQIGAGGVNIVNSGAAGMQAGATSASQLAGSWGSNATGAFGAQAAYKNGQDQTAGAGANGVLGLAGTALGAWASTGFAWCDRRLKRNIVQIGETCGGFALYAFEYLWGGGLRVGVMADEVSGVPGAVVRIGGINGVNAACLR